jgi:hypothetical protein
MLIVGHPQHILYCARNSDTTLHQEKNHESSHMDKPIMADRFISGKTN